MVAEAALPMDSCNCYDCFARCYHVGVVVRQCPASIYNWWWESRNPSRKLHHIHFLNFYVWFDCADTQYEFDANRSIAAPSRPQTTASQTFANSLDRQTAMALVAEI